MGIMQGILGFTRGLVDFEKVSLDRAIESSSAYAKGDLLDVGCGDKPYEPVFSGRVSSHVGLEYDDTYQAFSFDRKSKTDKLYDGGAFPFETGSFDTVLCTQVLEHVRDPRQLMGEMARVLRPGGHLILTTPFAYRLHFEPHDFWRFTRYGLEVLFEECGLELEYLDSRGGFWKAWGQAVNYKLLMRVAGMEGAIRDICRSACSTASRATPRYWTLPLVAPLVLVVALLVRFLDKLEDDETMTLGYIAVATRPG